MTTKRRDGAEPRVEVLSGSPTTMELAAVVIAVERLLAEREAAAGAGGSEPSRWQRAALEEGIGARAALGTGWGTPPNRANG